MSKLLSRVEIAAARLLTNHGFIGTLFSAIERKIDDNVPTAAASGNTISFNEAWGATLKARELLFVCAHEALHILFKHAYRRMERQHAIANIAMDAVINRMLINDSVGDMPVNADGTHKGVLIDWVTDDMDWETVYKKLMEDVESAEEKYGGGGFDGEGDIEIPGDTSEAAEAEVEITMNRVMSAAKAAGSKHALIERMFGEAKASSIDWRNELPATIAAGTPIDYSWSRFDLRFIEQNLYLPTMHSESVGRLVVGIDVSGSMTEQVLAQIQPNMRAIIEETTPSEVIVVCCDSSISHVDKFPQGTAVELKMYGGGGGTDMREIVHYANKLEGNICACIIFTDGYTPFVEEEPAYPLIWAILGNSSRFKIPVGRVVELIN